MFLLIQVMMKTGLRMLQSERGRILVAMLLQCHLMETLQSLRMGQIPRTENTTLKHLDALPSKEVVGV